MKYQANPVIVDAYKIVKVNKAGCMSGLPLGAVASLELEGGGFVTPTEPMMSRMEPQVGDYWVVQADGYVYLNPKNVFERKYSPAEKAIGA